MSRMFASAVLALAFVHSPAPALAGRALSYEDRLAAQEAIIAVYAGHQSGGTASAGAVVAATAPERQVRRYLLQGQLLESRWGVRVETADLVEEWGRIVAESRLPSRLAEIRQALGNDDRLLLECFVRPVLVDRLSRERFALDPAIHSARRAEAIALRERLLAGSDWRQETSAQRFRLVDESLRRPGAAVESADSGYDAVVLPHERFTRECSEAGATNIPGPVVDAPDAYRLTLRLAEGEGSVDVVRLSVAKVSWDEWFSAATAGMEIHEPDASSFQPVEGLALPPGPRPGSSPLPAAGATTGTCPESWTATSSIGAPSARYYHTGVWTGSWFIVWGGYNFGYTNTGGRYDPVTNSWTPTPLVNAPSARRTHTAVWTGSVMIVWGGYNGSPQQGGGRYDPVLDVWTPTTATNQPSPRFNHTAVWTGSEMIVWSGCGGHPNYPSTGGRYHPGTDAWVATATVGAPDGRELRSAVWTGTEMIIWGGQLGITFPVGTGGRYNPSTDSWTPTTALGAPSVRAYHRAVWTGTRMVVWGGYDWTIFLNTGAQYDPATDAWSPTTTSGAPTGRESFVGVWTGAEMIVWSGARGSSGPFVNDGARYEPLSDSWQPMTTVNAPVGRSWSAGAWTGTEMIAWGGYGPGGLSSGGRYSLGNPDDCDGDGFAPGVDCDDADARTYPGAAQVCDGRNNDCSDPAWPAVPADEQDQDADHWVACSPWSGSGGGIAGGGDCDDANAAVHPGASEACNLIDDDCDAQTDEGVQTDFYRDADSDGWGNPLDLVFACIAPPGYAPIEGDCDDADPVVHPEAPEVCDAKDNDCDGSMDEGPSGLDPDSDGVRSACDNCPLLFNPDQFDADMDQVGNACDNCLLVLNPAQTDQDADLVGDACDNCVLSYNPTQADGESDGVGDVCDNCPTTVNPQQADSNADNQGDLCDLDDGLLYFTRMLRSGRVEWQDEASYTTFNLYRGALARLIASGQYTQDPGVEPEAARWCNLTPSFQLDPGMPPSGTVNYYLVTGTSGGGAESSLGTRSDGTPRPNDHPCP